MVFFGLFVDFLVTLWLFSVSLWLFYFVFVVIANLELQADVVASGLPDPSAPQGLCLVSVFSNYFVYIVYNYGAP